MFNENHLKNAQQIVRAMNHEERQNLYFFIVKNPGKDVTTIWTKLKLQDQSTASQHLAILRKNKLVRCKRNGKQVMYFANAEYVKQIERIFSSLWVTFNEI